jgi:hypothetical protein
MRSMRLALGLLVTLLAFAALPYSGGLEEPQPLFQTLGRDPIYCAFIAADRQICTWHEGKSNHFVCELDSEGRLVGELCIRRDDNTSMTTFPSTAKNRSGRRRRMEKKKVCETEFAALEAAKSVREVCEFVGAGPRSCSVNAEDITCTWHAVRRTPGYISLARIARAAGKKVDMTCQFKEHGQSRESGTCHVYIAGKTPPSADQVPGCR